jgi:transposase InsO family protein
MTGIFTPAYSVSKRTGSDGQAHYRTRVEARVAVFAWINWYNRFRLHSTNGYLSPIEWEQQHPTISPLPSTMAA